MNEYNSKFTGTEIDAALSRALPGGAIDTDLALKAPLASPALTGTPTINGVAAANVGQLCNPNLLDNWYFGNPVDQRGGYVVPPGVTYWTAMVDGTSPGVTDKYYTAKVNSGRSDWYEFTKDGTDYYVPAVNVVRGYTGNGYGIDRWYGDGILIEPNGLTPTDQGKYILQNLDNELKKALDGKTVTVSALLSTGELLFGTKVYAAAPSAGEYFVAGTLHIVNNTNGSIMFWANQKATIVAAKLELGSQQTLAHQENGVWVLNEIPDYGEQLRRCQRYYYDSRFGRVNESDGAYSVTLTTSNAYFVGNYRFPVTMRVKPSITIYSIHGTANRVSYWASMADVNNAVEANTLSVGASGFNAVQAATAFDSNAYAFHIVANSEL